jgi:hypothetical protein
MSYAKNRVVSDRRGVGSTVVQGVEIRNEVSLMDGRMLQISLCFRSDLTWLLSSVSATGELPCMMSASEQETRTHRQIWHLLKHL